jgi:hypothetical protein
VPIRAFRRSDIKVGRLTVFGPTKISRSKSCQL